MESQATQQTSKELPPNTTQTEIRESPIDSTSQTQDVRKVRFPTTQMTQTQASHTIYNVPSDEGAYFGMTDRPPVRLSKRNSQTLPETCPEVDDFLERKRADKNVKRLLQEWHDFCHTQSVLHGMNSTFYQLWGNVISITAIVLSTLGGTSSIATSNSTGSSQVLSILFGAVGVLSGALMSIHRYLNLPELQRANQFYSDEYAKLKNEIHMQLYIHFSIHNKTYANLTEFCKATKHTLDSLIDRSPQIRPSVIRQYESNVKKNRDESSYCPSLMLFSHQNKQREDIEMKV